MKQNISLAFLAVSFFNYNKMAYTILKIQKYEPSSKPITELIKYFVHDIFK